MAGNWKLTEGAIARLMNGDEVELPVFQILGFKKIAGQGGSDRYRLNISDGTHSHTFAMLATQLNFMIPNNQLHNFCIIRGDKVVCNCVNGKRVLIILEVSVLATGSEVKTKLGNPIQYTEGSGATPAAPSLTSNPTRPRVMQEPEQMVNVVNQFRSPNKRKHFIEYTNDLNIDINEGVMPIQDINPYNCNRVAIKARVTNKTDIKTWSNAKGEGKLFSMDLLDDSGEIRMTAFKQQVDDFYDSIQVGHVYIFKNFTVKAANKLFSTLNNDYEVTANSDTIIVSCPDSDAADIPTASYNFVSIADIEEVEKDKIIDVIGVCKSVGELQQFTSKNTNKEFTKRDIVLVDKTNREINLTLWGKLAETFADDSNPVIAVKGTKVSDFNGKSLSCLNSSNMMINPDMPETHVLRGWYDNEGNAAESHSLSVRSQGGVAGTPWKILAEANTINDEETLERGDFFMSKVTVMSVKRENAFYKACPEANCNKKVIDSGNGFFRCERCNNETSDFKWRSMININFADASDFVWATCFSESAELILGDTCQNLGPISSDDPEQFDEILKEAVFKSYIIKFKSKFESYQGEKRLKHTVVDIQPVHFGEYGRKLLNELKEFA